MTEQQITLADPVFEAATRPDADGQFVLVVGFPANLDEPVLNAAQAELDAALAALDNALDTPRADLPAARLRVSRAFAALGF